MAVGNLLRSASTGHLLRSAASGHLLRRANGTPANCCNGTYAPNNLLVTFSGVVVDPGACCSNYNDTTGYWESGGWKPGEAPSAAPNLAFVVPLTEVTTYNKTCTWKLRLPAAAAYQGQYAMCMDLADPDCAGTPNFQFLLDAFEIRVSICNYTGARRIQVQAILGQPLVGGVFYRYMRFASTWLDDPPGDPCFEVSELEQSDLGACYGITDWSNGWGYEQTPIVTIEPYDL